MKVLIIGAGGHARVIADALASRAQIGEKHEIVGFLDDDEALRNHARSGVRVLGKISEIDEFDHDAVVIGIGDNLTRQKIYKQVKAKGENIITVIHAHTVHAPDVVVGDGTVCFAGVIVNSGAVIGSNVILNTSSTVDHDAVVGSHAHICPGAHLGGGVKIGEGAFIGIGSSIIHNRTVGNWAIVGSGAVVIRDVPPFQTVVGIPAKPLPEQLTKNIPDDRDMQH